MNRYPDPSGYNGPGDDLDGVMLTFMRSLSGGQGLALSAWITENTKAEMNHQLRIDHPDWEEWQVARELAYWSYGSDEMDNVPAHVWQASWLAARRRDGGGGNVESDAGSTAASR